ncbi:hypothetical protein BJ138DRAFT_704756 [Hygrophoropsis aurantiaca]|uniref:Uncharacterized protein n=1 Tax=Hygrophoropsis aurantiaca TaxID=72124 RepID=A0ACB7ZYD8_9AGAM|nr:hypothetical protein BJ138DRAFT_704756 [Hygrophoropsis aurantiaca]
MPSDGTARKRQPNILKYSKPTAQLFESALPTLKEESRHCIENLLKYRAQRTRAKFPRSLSAAVLVPLFIGRAGDLYVLLSRRSADLREYGGDTALPGGKVDPQDLTIEDTARREAFEEIGLPQDRTRVPLLCIMEPFLAGNMMVVTPVVVLILDKTLQPNLNEAEVTSIFAHPLASFLSETPPSAPERAPTRSYHTFTDVPSRWSEGAVVRLHRFLTGRESEGVKPVFGLTSNILIHTATHGYARLPTFEVQPPNAPTTAQRIAHALLTPNSPLHQACVLEGIDPDKTAARVLKPPFALNSSRMAEWEGIGASWKQLMENGEDAMKRQDNSHNGFVSGGNPGGERSQKRVDEIKQRIQKRMNGNGEDGDGLGGRIEEFKKRALERKEQGNGRSEDREEHTEKSIPDIAKLEEYLDRTRDMVNERLEEVAGDERKLAKARKAYPKVLESVKKQFENMQLDGREMTPETLWAMIPKEAREGMDLGKEAGKEGAKRGHGFGEGLDQMDDGLRTGKEGMRKGLEEMKKYVGKGGDGHNPEQNIKKRDAKL